jgi:uncharacterized paraquat-inducible protein A
VSGKAKYNFLEFEQSTGRSAQSLKIGTFEQEDFNTWWARRGFKLTPSKYKFERLCKHCGKLFMTSVSEEKRCYRCRTHGGRRKVLEKAA